MAKVTIKEKAVEFLQAYERQDSRCFIVLLMLSQLFNITPEAVKDKITELSL